MLYLIHHQQYNSKRKPIPPEWVLFTWYTANKIYSKCKPHSACKHGGEGRTMGGSSKNILCTRSTTKHLNKKEIHIFFQNDNQEQNKENWHMESAKGTKTLALCVKIFFWNEDLFVCLQRDWLFNIIEKSCQKWDKPFRRWRWNNNTKLYNTTKLLFPYTSYYIWLSELGRKYTLIIIRKVCMCVNEYAEWMVFCYLYIYFIMLIYNFNW